MAGGDRRWSGGGAIREAEWGVVVLGGRRFRLRSDGGTVRGKEWSMAIRWHIRWRSHGETARVKGWYDTGPELPRINPMNSQGSHPSIACHASMTPGSTGWGRARRCIHFAPGAANSKLVAAPCCHFCSYDQHDELVYSSLLANSQLVRVRILVCARKGARMFWRWRLTYECAHSLSGHDEHRGS